MQELSIKQIIKYSLKSMLGSKVLILFVLEFIILVISFLFSKFMNKKVVNRTCIISSIIVFGLYISNYIETLMTFIDNVSTRFMEFIYFPTTLEFMAVMFLSFGIMFVTLLSKKTNIIIKFINSLLPVGISYLFLNIIEYINKNNIDFNEFSVFTDPTLTSLYEIAMCLFAVWLIGLIIYKVDVVIINYIASKDEFTEITFDSIEESNDEIELPKLKESRI